MRRIIVFFAVAAAMAAPAYADILVDQVERLDVERGEAEWELQAIHARSVGEEPSESMLNISAEFGLNDRLALGFEVESEREGGDALEAEMIALQAKVVAIDPEEAIVGIGAQLSLGRSFRGAETEAELRLLAETRFGADVALAGDITLESAVEGEEEHDVLVRYAARLDWERGWGVLALEAGGDWGSLENIEWSEEGRHWVGPILSADAFGIVQVETGMFAGLTEATPDTQFRLELAFR